MQRDVTGGFGEIRSLAHGTPSAASFRAICARLDALSPARRGEVIDYLDGALRGWPDIVRWTPDPWTEALGHGEAPAGLRLTRGASLSRWRLAQAQQLATIPAIRAWERLVISDPVEEGVPEALADAEALARVHALTCLNPRRRVDLRRMMRAASWRLDTLLLWRTVTIGDALADALRTPALATLRELHLSACPWAGGVDALIDHAPQTLSTLSLHEMGLRERELARLGDAALAEQITALSCGQLTGEPQPMWSALLGGRWVALERLKIEHLALDVASALREAPWRHTLQELELNVSALGAQLPELMRALSTHESLRALHLSRAGHDGAALVAEDHSVLRRLDRLHVSEMSWDDDALRALAERLSARCHTLRLQRCGLTDAQLHTLLSAGRPWRALHTLELDHNRITEASVHALLDAQVAPALRHVQLDHNPFDAQVLARVHQRLAQRDLTREAP